MGRLVFDFVNSNGILEYHSIGAFEIEEPRAGSWMAARTENNGHAALAQKIERSQHIVAGLHLMVDMLNAGMRRAHQRDRVVDRIDAHQRNVPDPVADARVANLGPEPFVASRVGG